MRWPWSKPEQRTATLEATLLALRSGQPSAAGIWVDTMAALTNDVCWACTALLSDVISGLPFRGYKSVGDSREKLDPQPQVVTHPSGWLETTEWVGQLVVGMCLDGNTIGHVVGRDFHGYPTQCEIRAWEDVTVFRDGKTSPPRYKLDGKEVPAADIVHWRGSIMRPGEVVAQSPVTAAREAIATALATERFGAQFFGQGAHPSSILKTDQRVEADVADAIKKRFMAATANHEPAVLGQGLTYEAIQATPGETQMVEAQEAVARRVVRFFRIQPEMIGISSAGGSITYSNQEQAAIRFVKFDLLGWLTPIETRWGTLIPRGSYVKANVDALLRADLMTRFNAYNIAIRNGTMNQDEARALEDRKPLPGGQGSVFLDPSTTPPASTGDGNVQTKP